jgi:hypothetical protein
VHQARAPRRVALEDALWVRFAAGPGLGSPWPMAGPPSDRPKCVAKSTGSGMVQPSRRPHAIGRSNSGNLKRMTSPVAPTSMNRRVPVVIILSCLSVPDWPDRRPANSRQISSRPNGSTFWTLRGKRCTLPESLRAESPTPPGDPQPACGPHQHRRPLHGRHDVWRRHRVGRYETEGATKSGAAAGHFAGSFYS